MKISDIDVVVLCGGFGKRLKVVVNDRPKPMADLDGEPFLEILIDLTALFGFRRFILCTGYMGTVISEYFSGKDKKGIEIFISEEKSPLGTGGALKKAEEFINSSCVLVLNGDSICRADLEDLTRFHEEKDAQVSMVLSRVNKCEDYGTVTVGEDDRITGFKEKAGVSIPGLVNAGIYLFRRDMIKFMPEGKSFSLEKDFFPAHAGERFFGYITDEPFRDIGTPERYEECVKTRIENKRR